MKSLKLHTPHMSDREQCKTCYGTGELVTEQGATTCPDCFGEGAPLGRSARVEWRLRELERVHQGSGQEAEADVLWLVHELRKSRDALTRIFTICQDAGDEPLALDIKYQANEALGLYEPKN
jgi:hypothetical protein